MSLIRKLVNKLRYGAAAPPPPAESSPIEWRDDIVIHTDFGPIPEKFRRQACINMRLDPHKFLEVERVILRECKGDQELARRIMRERYPEACPEGY